MTSISTEDTVLGAFMRMGRIAGMALFTVLTLAMIASSLAITPGYISDTNASTYIIVPMIMLPVFAAFMLKEKKIEPEVDINSIILGVILFALFIVLELDSLGYLGVEFFAYRIDMLIVPIGLVALASLIFGIRNLGKFAWIAIYAMFASPVLLAPVINLNLGFASANSVVIFQLLKPVFTGISFVGPITIYLNGHGVSIGNTCIGIGAIVGLVMFLVPVAYFMDGRPKDRFVWVLSAIGMMIIFNFMRMLLITISWFAYGPNSVTLAVHAVVGQLIFYAVIVLILLLHGRYGLDYPKIMVGKERYDYNGIAIFAACAFSVLYLFLSLSYLIAQQAPAQVSYATTLNAGSIVSLYSSYISYNGTTLSAMGAENKSIGITLQNATAGGKPVLIIFALPGTGKESSIMLGEPEVWKEYMRNGNEGRLYYIPGTPPSLVYTTKVLYNSSGSSHAIDMIVASQAYSQTVAQECLNSYDRIYGFFANIAQLNPNTLNASLDGQYCRLTEVLK
ncbi:exosortase/archaeosortase family protein [Candidatus Marsarchaeota archaeon]|nr:exosortase/archaeosortase family protein [Candidatus Marsarchaeota archaeon]